MCRVCVPFVSRLRIGLMIYQDVFSEYWYHLRVSTVGITCVDSEYSGFTSVHRSVMICFAIIRYLYLFFPWQKGIMIPT